MCSYILSDLLRGFSALPKTLRPTFFRHPVAIHFCSLEQIPMLECLPLHQPVLWLCCHAHHSCQLHFPCHAREHRGSRVRNSHEWVIGYFGLKIAWVFVQHVLCNACECVCVVYLQDAASQQAIWYARNVEQQSECRDEKYECKQSSKTTNALFCWLGSPTACFLLTQLF